jgi:hypothetical protein
VGNDRILRWPKVAGEAVVPQALLVQGEIGDLPAPRDIAAARLVVPVAAGHEKAPGQLGAAILKEAVVDGKPCDLENLGDLAGVVVIPRQPADRLRYDPPLPCVIDVTRTIKAVAAGEARFHGFGLRIVPSRPVDDGWTVRADIPGDGKIVLEIDVFAGAPEAPR